MAQPAHCIRSVFGLQCFFLFLLTSLEAEYSSSDALISTETHKPKHQCTTTHRSKLAHQSSTTQVAPPASEQTSSKQRIGPTTKNEHASEPNDTTNTDRETHTTPVPNRKNTTCLKSTTSRSTVTSKSAKVVSSTSNKTTEKTTQNLGKGSDHKQSTTGCHEWTTGTPVKSTEHEAKTTGDNERATGASEKSTGHEGKTTSNHERPTETYRGNITRGQENTTGTPETPTEHEGKTTWTHYKTTGGSAKSTRHQEKTTSVTEIIKTSIKLTAKNTAATENIRPTVKVTGNASISTRSPCTSNKAPRCVRTGSSTPPTSIVSDAPDNKSHTQQNKNDSQVVPEGETEGSDSFPAWAIVVVILLSVILLLVFISLIVLASYLARTCRALTQNTENNDSENVGGSNSYPVYLMEQQTLGPSQTPGPR
ncbi:mucin-like protein 3 isoform X2 [Bos taurus]|uniref:mucin-like protein 3 isoform X2 n=1 Tax=Bos taurus TaxID=9913 RepID=UPI000572DCF1|nr:mucin-like protein 3 isoform X2 [Bos taurus]